MTGVTRATRWIRDNGWWFAPAAGAVLAVALVVVVYGFGGLAVTHWLLHGGPVDPAFDAKLTVLCKIAFLWLVIVAVTWMGRSRSEAGSK